MFTVSSSSGNRYSEWLPTR
uniref:Uncharacterized protein n=1 Tax=Anguilla anguilla TaxID=7936 RepID=A0A0E9R233_ANGAN